MAAAFQLQNRLYYVLQPSYRQMWPEGHLRGYIPLSTAWLFAQYFGWIEIVRREAQILDLGEFARTAGLQAAIQEVSEVFATGTRPELDDRFSVFRAQQSAIGELMIVSHHVAGEERADVMGYAEFSARMETGEGISVWMSSIVASITSVVVGDAVSARGVLLQRGLVDLVDYLDPERVRFPDLNERGRHLPPGLADWRPRAFPPEIARFRNLSGLPVEQIWEAWAHRMHLGSRRIEDGDTVELRAVLRRRLLGRSRTAVLRLRGIDVLLFLYISTQLEREAAERRDDVLWAAARQAPRNQLSQVNELLEALGRPILLRVGDSLNNIRK